MNRHNLLGHLALALTVILVAAFAGQLRRWHHEWGNSSHVENKATVAQKSHEQKAEVLVRFRAGTTFDRIREIVFSHHERLEDQIEAVDGLEVIEDEDGRTAGEVADEYRALPEVIYAEPNSIINLDQEENENSNGGEAEETSGSDEASDIDLSDPMFGEQWALENTGQRGGQPKADISAKRAWEKTTGDDDVVVAVLDSGVNYLHPDLLNNMWVRPDSIAPYRDDQLGTIDDQHGFNSVDTNGDPMDENGHGTHCAGIIGAEGDNDIGIAGVNWDVKIMPLKFMTAGGFGTTKDAVECINYVIDRKKAGVNVRIISASWGSTQSSRALKDVIQKAYEAGILFVAASGNASSDADRSPHYPASYDVPNIISVAATNRNDELASFSNYGAKSVHVAAPGVEILSTWLGNDFKEASGTSMATPMVAGEAALILSVEPGLSVDDLRERIFKSVDPLPALKGKVQTGGRINAAKAVNAE